MVSDQQSQKGLQLRELARSQRGVLCLLALPISGEVEATEWLLVGWVGLKHALQVVFGREEHRDRVQWGGRGDPLSAG